MKQHFKLCSRIITAFSLAAAIVLPCMPNAAAESINDKALAKMKDNNIPVVYISIDESAEGYGTIQEMNDSPDHSVKCTGTVRIDVPDGYTGDYSDTELTDTDELQLDYIRGRGNITWNVDKKPYKFKLDKKEELLGMGKNKHWALLANRYDGSMLRNRLVSYISEQLGFEYTPKMLPVDLVMNGKYMGSYFLSETVRIGKSRLDIGELTAEDNTEPNITGGYLLGINPFSLIKEFPEDNISNISGLRIWHEDPEFASNDGDETGTPEQHKYIDTYLQNLSEAIFSSTFKNSDGVPYYDYMDLKSTADFWLVQAFTLNHDAYDTTSNYFYKKRNDKLFWGPLWDFDYSMGLLFPDTEGFNQVHCIWIDRLRAYEPEFQKLLRERWNVLDGIITDILKDGGIIDQYVAEQRSSAELDYEILKNPSSYHRQRYEFDKEVELLRTWLKERQLWINQNIDKELTNAFPTVTFADGDEVISVFKPEIVPELGNIPEAPQHEGKVFLCWQDENGTQYSYGTILTHDTILYACYIETDEPTDEPEESDEPEYSEISEEPENSDVPESSEKPENSDVPESSEEPENSDVPGSSEEPENSDISEISDVSVSAPDISSDTSENTESQPIPSANIPKTGDSSSMPIILFAAAASILAAAISRKRTNNR